MQRLRKGSLLLCVALCFSFALPVQLFAADGVELITASAKKNNKKKKGKKSKNKGWKAPTRYFTTTVNNKVVHCGVTDSGKVMVGKHRERNGENQIKPTKLKKAPKGTPAFKKFKRKQKQLKEQKEACEAADSGGDGDGDGDGDSCGWFVSCSY